MLYSGQKVECVSVHRRGHQLAFIRLGEKYTIDRVFTNIDYGTGREYTVVTLIEIMPRGFKNGKPKGYPPECFRPLCNKKTDISELKKLLITDNLKVDLTNVE